MRRRWALWPTSSGHYSNRDLPSEGLLVWRIGPEHGSGQTTRVELVSADGRNHLQSWSGDGVYAQVDKGNLGDATDPYDGSRFTRVEIAAGIAADKTALVVRRAATGVWVTLVRGAVSRRSFGDAFEPTASQPTLVEDISWGRLKTRHASTAAEVAP